MTTTAPPSEAITASAVLFGDSDLMAALEASGAAGVVQRELASFTQTTCDEAVSVVGRICAELMSLDLTDLILGAWTTCAALRAAAQRTVGTPRSEELVELLSHRVTFDNQPSIDLLVNGVLVATVRLALSLVIDIQALTATVRHGCLIALQVGRCDLDGSVSIEGKMVAHRQAQLQLPFSLRLGSGVAILADRSAPPAGHG
jgi:hypothetical protein